MSASAAFDSYVCEFLYLYYSPFLVFDSDESATYFYESMFYGFLLESYTDSEIYELWEQVSADCIIGYDSVVVGESAVNLANDFSLFLLNFNWLLWLVLFVSVALIWVKNRRMEHVESDGRRHGRRALSNLISVGAEIIVSIAAEAEKE